MNRPGSGLAWHLTLDGPDVPVPTRWGRRRWRECGAQRRFPVGLLSCSRPSTHHGRHAAYGFGLVVAVWPR